MSSFEREKKKNKTKHIHRERDKARETDMHNMFCCRKWRSAIFTKKFNNIINDKNTIALCLCEWKQHQMNEKQFTHKKTEHEVWTHLICIFTAIAEEESKSKRNRNFADELINFRNFCLMTCVQLVVLSASKYHCTVTHEHNSR